MIRTTCPHCKTKEFELRSVQTEGTTVTHTAIQCIKCGAPIGFVDSEILESTLDTHRTQLDALGAQLHSVQQKVLNIENAVSEIFDMVKEIQDNSKVS